MAADRHEGGNLRRSRVWKAVPANDNVRSHLIHSAGLRCRKSTAGPLGRVPRPSGFPTVAAASGPMAAMNRPSQQQPADEEDKEADPGKELIGEAEEEEADDANDGVFNDDVVEDNAPRRTGQAAEEKSEAERDPDADMLFRFIDYSVVEGKRYRWRGVVVLDNPNFGLFHQFLEPEARDSAGVSQLQTAWSKVTTEISVPRSNYVRQGPVKPAAGTMEPMVNVAVVQWNHAG